MPDHSKRRFIAGAVCPGCGALDRIVVDADAGRRECVACGFQEQRPEADSVLPREAVDRVSGPAIRREETPTDPITLIDSRSAPDEA